MHIEKKDGEVRVVADKKEPTEKAKEEPEAKPKMQRFSLPLRSYRMGWSIATLEAGIIIGLITWFWR